MISSFSGEYRWLSNFVPAHVILDGMAYPSVECAYQAAKTLVISERIPFQKMQSGQAKRAGKYIGMRADWDEVKLDVMTDLCTQKFNQSNYKALLLDTYPEDIIEGNYWHDYFWGVCNGKGENHLGNIIMDIRDELRSNS